MPAGHLAEVTALSRHDRWRADDQVEDASHHRRPDPWPERPVDLDPHVPPVALLDAYERHLVVLAAARAGRPAEPPPAIGARALAALAIAHAVIDDLAEERWPIVRDALVHGVGYARVSAATRGFRPTSWRPG